MTRQREYPRGTTPKRADLPHTRDADTGESRPVTAGEYRLLRKIFGGKGHHPTPMNIHAVPGLVPRPREVRI